LATLAAYDVRAMSKKHNCSAKVTCITFGAPRTGNHSFARELQEMVPDCWHVINGDPHPLPTGASRAYACQQEGGIERDYPPILKSGVEMGRVWLSCH